VRHLSVNQATKRGDFTPEASGWQGQHEQSPGDEIGRAHLYDAIKLIFSREQKSYEIILSRLKSNQVKVLTALARQGGRSPMSALFVKAAGVKNASVVKQSLESLANQKILYQAGKEWKYSNPFFKAWILHRSSVEVG